MKSALWLILFLALTLVTRCWNYADVFVADKIYFVDGDCYSRMTRARMVYEHPGTIVRHHDFENFPQGIAPHTTAPMDYLIAWLAWLLRPFTSQPLDLAGAIISPLLGLGTTAFLWYWALDLIQHFRKLMLLLASLSPILAHGTVLGRPDHQSLLIFLLTAGLGAELAMARTVSVKWSVISGVAWGLSFWVSLYEPLILAAVVIGVQLFFFRAKLFARERLWGLGIGVAILATALLIEGWHVQLPDEATRIYFLRWKQTVGELSTVNILSPLVFRWVGFGLFVAPMLLIARLRDARRSIIMLALLTVTFVLTLSQLRWGYFFALVFAISLPWQLSPFEKRPLLVCAVFFASLWPMLRDWEERLRPNDQRLAEIVGQRRDAFWLRDAAEHLEGEGAILAPWWLSPALVYWSGKPALAGSSHESLPGSVETARFYLSETPLEAATVLRERKVSFVLADDPDRVLSTSAGLLGRIKPASALATILYEQPRLAPPFLALAHVNPVFKLFKVEEKLLP